MKKITVMALTALLAAGSLFAQPTAAGGFKKHPEASERPAMEQMHKFPKQSGALKMDSLNDTVIIGVVKSVNTKAGTIKVINADNREIEVTVTPFTKVNVKNTTSPDHQGKKGDRPENKNFKPDTIADIRAGDWAKISTYRTDTKALSAAKVAVISTQPKYDLSNAK